MKTIVILALFGCLLTPSLAVSVKVGGTSAININTNSSQSASDTIKQTATYPTTSFKSPTSTSGPYGGTQGTPFNFQNYDFGQFLATLTVTADSTKINSLQMDYENPIELLITSILPNGTTNGALPSFTSPLAGAKAGQTSEWTRQGGEYITKASVCTGKVGANTVVTGLRFVTDQGQTTTFGAYKTTNTKCLDVTPKTPGYRLDYLSGTASTVINQLTLHWKSDFAEERACLFDTTCLTPIDVCNVEGTSKCCYKKTTGQTVGQLSCVA